MSERSPTSTAVLEPGQLPPHMVIEGQIGGPVVDQLEAAYHAPSAPEPEYLPVLAHEANATQAIDPTIYAAYKQDVLAPKQPAVEASTDLAGQQTIPEMPAVGQSTGVLPETFASPTAETVATKRKASLGRIALRMSGLTTIGNFAKDAVTDARISVNELRADNHKFSAQRGDRKVLKAQHKEANKLNREFDFRQHAAALRAEADSGEGNAFGREFKRGRADFAERRADKRQRKAQKLARKVLSKQVKRNDHLVLEQQLREQAERFDQK